MRKKILSLILATAMVATLFIGCGKTDKDDAKDTAKTADTADSADAKDTADATADAAGGDLSGKTVGICI
jgi:Ni/Co efflux regulator RcnB